MAHSFYAMKRDQRHNRASDPRVRIMFEVLFLTQRWLPFLQGGGENSLEISTVFILNVMLVAYNVFVCRWSLAPVVLHQKSSANKKRGAVRGLMNNCSWERVSWCAPWAALPIRTCLEDYTLYLAANHFSRSWNNAWLCRPEASLELSVYTLNLLRHYGGTHSSWRVKSFTLQQPEQT